MHALSVSIDGQWTSTYEMLPGQLEVASGGWFTTTFAQCRAARQPAHFVVGGLTEWDELSVSLFFGLVKELAGHCLTSFEEPTAPATTDLFAGLVAQIPPRADTRHIDAVAIAIRAAAVFRPKAIERAAEAIHDRLVELGNPKYRVLQIEKRIRDIVQPNARLDPLEIAMAYLEWRRATGFKPLRLLRGEWHEWTGTHYRLLPDDFVKISVIDYLQRNEEQYKKVAKTKGLFNDIVANVDALCTPTTQQPTIELPCWVPDTGPAVPFKAITCRNGFVPLDTILAGSPVLYTHSPQWITTTALPYDWDPSATCPQWEGLLAHNLASTRSDDHRIEVLQEIMGGCLILGMTLEDTILAMLGTGRNGKSVVIKIIEAMLGDDNVSHVPIELLEYHFERYAMLGKLANTCSDMEHVDKVAEGIIKQLSSGDMVTWPRKGKPSICARPTAKLIYACNQLPTFADRSEGLWRRLRVMPFLVEIPAAQADRTLADRLKGEELSGILQWSVRGLQRYLQNGRLTECAICREAGQGHRRDCDPVTQWLDEHCIRGFELSVAKRSAYESYAEFCEANGYRAKGTAKFGRDLGQLGIHEGRPGTDGPRPRCYLGIAVAGGPMQA